MQPKRNSLHRAGLATATRRESAFPACPRGRVIHPGRVHAPYFSIHHKLSDWPECVVEASCGRCQGRKAAIPVRLLLERGDRPFA